MLTRDPNQASMVCNPALNKGSSGSSQWPKVEDVPETFRTYLVALISGLLASYAS
jgi:hypothetical protein